MQVEDTDSWNRDEEPFTTETAETRMSAFVPVPQIQIPTGQCSESQVTAGLHYRRGIPSLGNLIFFKGL